MAGEGKTVSADELLAKIGAKVDEEVMHLHEVIAEKDRDLEAYRASHGSLQSIFRALHDAQRPIEPPPSKYVADAGAKPVDSPCVAVMRVSDGHHGAIQEAMEIEGINHFNPDFLLNIENEFDIWRKSAALPTRGSSIYGLALYANDHNIPLKIVVGEKEYKFPGYKFKSYKKKEINIAHFASELFYKRVKETDIGMEERNFDLNEVKKLLKEGKIILLRLVIGIIRNTKTNKRNPHYLPVYGFKDNKYLIMDPRRGALEIDEKTMAEAFNKVIDIKRDPRMIVFG